MRDVHQPWESLPAWPTPGADPREGYAAPVRGGAGLGRAALLIAAIAVPATAENPATAPLTVTGSPAARAAAPGRPVLIEAKPAVDTCLGLRELRFAQVRTVELRQEHAVVRLASAERAWECLARLDGEGLFSLRVLEDSERHALTAAAGPRPEKATEAPAEVLRAAADPERATAAPPASATRGRLMVVRRDASGGTLFDGHGGENGVALSLTALNSPAAAVKLSAEAMHGRAPGIFDGGVFGLGAPWLVRESQRWGLGLDLSFLKGRLRYQGRHAGSSESRTLSDARPAGLNETAPIPEWLSAYLTNRHAPATTSTSTHRADIQLMRSGRTALSVYGAVSQLASAVGPYGLGYAGPLFTGATVGAAQTAEVREAGGRADLKRLRLTLSQREETRADRQASRLKAKAVYGPVGVSVTQRTLDRVSASGRRSLREALDGRFDLSLEERRWSADGEGGVRRLLPSSVWLSAGRARTSLSWLPGGPAEEEDTWGAGLSWSWENGDTDFSFTSGQAASRRFTLAPSDSDEWSLDFSQTLYGHAWDLTGYAYASSTHASLLGSDTAETIFGGGVSASIRPERLPDASLSVSLDRFDAFYGGFDESGRRSLDLRLDLDFTKYMPNARHGLAPQLTAGWYVQRALSRDSRLYNPEEWALAGYVRFARPF